MIFRTGDFVVDGRTRQLLLAGRDVHLTPKAFELLQLLLENRDRALAKSELQQRIWPDTFVEETNLASLVAEIRRALGDTATNSTFIGTVYGFGYRFLAAVHVVEEHARAEAPLPKFWLAMEGRRIPLLEGATVIGRAPDAGISIDAPSMSRYHARVVVHGTEAILEDLGSKNGTHVNGEAVQAPHALHDGDAIRLGAIELTLRQSSALDPTETLPHGTR